MIMANLPTFFVLTVLITGVHVYHLNGVAAFP
jgi:hypothetical protein